MKPRPAPRPINYKKPLPKKLKSDPQVIKWAQRLKGDRSARPRHLSEEELAWVGLELMKTRLDFSPAEGDLYLKAMADTCPVIAAPELERGKLHEDLALIWSQPEMRRAWEQMGGPSSQRGPQPNYFTAKALMATMGTAGISAHADDNYAELNAGLVSVFAALDGEPRELAGYENALKRFPRIANAPLFMAANVRMVRALRELLPDSGIGERLMIDGMGTPAWCKQIGTGKTSRQEAYRRRLLPYAGARSLMHASGGKRDVSYRDGAIQFIKVGKFWRGYYTIALADQACGLPLVWTIQDAALDEARALVPLLSTLYRLWPDCPAKLIAGDSAWDEDAWCRLCEVDYGIHPIFRLHPNQKSGGIKGFSRDGTVAGFTREGKLVCAAHRKDLEFAGVERASREGLAPGKTSREGAFRVRGKCRDGCGTLGLRMETDWSRLTYYPHYSSLNRAAAQRFAMREAMLTRLNGMEGIFDRIQVGRKLGTDGADRTRIRDKGAHETILSLAFASMTAAALADQRRRAGIEVTPLEPAPAPPPRAKAPSAVPALKLAISQLAPTEELASAGVMIDV